VRRQLLGRLQTFAIKAAGYSSQPIVLKKPQSISSCNDYGKNKSARQKIPRLALN
jgi:hypothetical protein